MNILMTGATGLVGTALVKALVGEGHTIYRLLRPGKEKSGEAVERVVDVPWNSSDGEIGGVIGGVDAAINLAGASIMSGRWTDKRKAVLRSSRVEITRGLVSAMAKMNPRPRVLVSASAVGYYGNRGDKVLTEKSEVGRGFLAELAREWEAEAIRAEALGVRVVRTRFGIILAKEGGALPQMMAPLKFGLGGKLGSGRQWMSWVALDDVVAIMKRALVDDALSGAVNVVAPEAVRNDEFTAVLAKVMHRPAIFAAPAFVLRLAMGEMADEALLASERATPQKLEQAKYQFIHSNLGEALQALLR
ncbi:MAG: TIGR01777 family oxidoreductase [Candidatus Acidiferrum sp.]